ncbi:MAG: DUF4870 domain-containing protein [Anaerolineales bacterium]|nr:DUF4870 domain-containing protein [Anaerolineales bacterium]
MNEKLTTDEKLIAAIAHGSIVANGLGILVGVVVFLTQREKSPYAARQGIQAAIFQLLGFIAMIALWIIWGFFYALTFIPIIQNPDLYQDAPPPIFWVGLASMVIPLAFMVIWGLYGLWGALQCWRGRDFNYILLGKLIPTNWT